MSEAVHGSIAFLIIADVQLLGNHPHLYLRVCMCVCVPDWRPRLSGLVGRMCVCVWLVGLYKGKHLCD